MERTTREKEINKIFTLICENVFARGGPMAYPTTEFRWSKLFSDKDKAKAYAEEYYGRGPEPRRWQKNGKELFWDSGPYIFIIKEEKVL